MPDADRSARQRGGRSRRNALIGLTAFVVVSLGVGPRLVDYYFDRALDNVADQLGSVEIETAYLATEADEFAWAFAEPHALGDSSMTSEDAKAYAVEHGVSIGQYGGQIVIESNRAQDLIITEMRARVIRESEPLSGTLFLPRDAGGGPTRPVIRVWFTLGGSGARAAESCTGANYFAGTKLHLSRGEAMVVHVLANGASDLFYEWVIDVELAIGTDVRTVTIPDPADPLRLTAAAPRYGSVYGPDPDALDGVAELSPEANDGSLDDPRLSRPADCT